MADNILHIMSDASRPPVKRHHWIVRLTHWATLVLLVGMVTSGLQIYGAYARFGARGGPYYINPFQDAQFPGWSRLGGWLAGGLNWHFALMWGLGAVGLLYLGYLIVEPGGMERILTGVYADDELLDEVRAYFDLADDTTAARPRITT